MFCSIIIPTIGRVELSRAVESVLQQNFTNADFEVIVVNDSGRSLPDANWQYSTRVQVIHTTQRERSVARNTGAAIAKGEYLHFLDDDDWLLPDALETFWQLAGKNPMAAWLYGGSQLVDRAGHPIIKLIHQMSGNCFIQVMAGEWLPLQSSCIKTKHFFARGGFNPQITGPEDIDLCRRIALYGDMAVTSNLVACIGMGVEKSTTDYDRSPIYSRWAREAILDEPGVFSRMLDSADNAAWTGRILRIYLTSVVWNLQHKKGFTAASRLAYGVVSLLTAKGHLFSPDYWNAIAKNYESETFARGFQEANRPIEYRKLSEHSHG